VEHKKNNNEFKRDDPVFFGKFGIAYMMEHNSLRPIQTLVLVHVYPDLPSFETSVEEVYILLTQVDPSKAIGPDGIAPKLLKEMSFELS